MNKDAKLRAGFKQLVELYHPETTPGFWNEYKPPLSELSAAIQMPLDDRWSSRVMNAYRRSEIKDKAK